MKQIDEPRLEQDIAYRFEYLSEFIGFTEQDIQTIHASAEALAPLVPSLVDAVYDKLFEYDATKRHFVPRQHGYEGPLAADVESLQMTDHVIVFRKQHLARYLANLVTKPYDTSMLKYLDMVGRIHTPLAGNPELDVPLVQMDALMGFVSDALIVTITGLGLDRETEVAALRAFNKLLWIQQDLINNSYQDAQQALGSA